MIAGVVVTLLLISCNSGNSTLKEGVWRGVFDLESNEIPFIFEVKGSSPDSLSVSLINGEERFPLGKITYRNDSVTIPVDLYDAVLTGKLLDNRIDGRFIRLTAEKPDKGIPFKAQWGQSQRFLTVAEIPQFSLGGTWDIEMLNPDHPNHTVGIFEQRENLLTGSILTNSGDYRFLEGVVYGKRFQLSAFSGSSPYLVEGEFTSDSTFVGAFVTPRRSVIIEGRRNPSAALADPYGLSALKEGFTTLDFSFPNLDGNPVSLADSRYKGKVVIVSILGSWCPNCLDEAAFLSPWYKENRKRGVEILGLAFERKNDFDFAKRTLTRLIERFDIQYQILFAGQSGTDSASKALPALNGIAAFPTTIFIDKKGAVRKVHTGFSGPATGKFYEDFKGEFNRLVDTLLVEE